MKIVFFGTPDFATASLQALLQTEGIEVVGVVTSTDKWGGRGGKELLQSDVKRYASTLPPSIAILQPEKLKNTEFVAALQALNADLHVVVAFRMLPEIVWQMPRLGTINLHGSLLPQYRGAAPINWAIIKGERETGVTTFFLQHEIDTGDLIAQERTPIGENETFGEVYERLKHIGAALLSRTVQQIAAGTYTQQPQDLSRVSHAPKIFHETCRMDIQGKTARELHNFVRGLSPYPAAWLRVAGLVLKIYSTRLEEIADESSENTPIGYIVADRKAGIMALRARGGWLHLLEIQPEKRRRMSASDLLNGGWSGGHCE